MSQGNRLLTPFERCDGFEEIASHRLLKAQDTKSYTQALKDVGEYFEGRILGEPPDNLGHPFVQVTGYEIIALKKGTMPGGVK